MKLFGLDQHVSTYSDLSYIYGKLGHEYHCSLISGHSWVVGRQKENVPLVENNITGLVEKEIWREFHQAYSERLAEYDAFVVSYPPAFSLLYKQFIGKRVVVHIPIRYDFPYTDRDEQRKVLDSFLLSDAVILCANNRLDKAYFEDRTGTKDTCRYIPSLCAYTGMKWAPKRDDFLLYDGSRRFQIDNATNRYDMHPHSWDDIQSFPAIVHIPYQISLMSIFEQYQACIPLFVPSKELLLKMYHNKADVLGQCFWSREQHGKYGFGTMEAVLDLADYYNDEWFPMIQKFNSVPDLEERLYDDAFLEHVSKEMEIGNRANRCRIMKAWEDVLAKVKS
jgi:hypothetical protein